MHIVVVTTSYPYTDDDAAGHFVKAEVDVLLRAGHTVTVIAPQPQGVASPEAPTYSTPKATQHPSSGSPAQTSSALQECWSG